MQSSSKPGVDDEPHLGRASSESADRRSHPREPRNDPIRVFVDDSENARIIDGALVNLSPGGALISADDCIMPGQDCLVMIIVPSGAVVRDAAFATVRWACVGDEQDFRIGVKFADRESLSF